MRERLGSCTAYAQASLEEIYGDLKPRTELRVNWLETTLFLNRGGRFEARALPVEAQLAPSFGVCVSDLDGDGNEDLFLSQNFFANAIDLSRNDAGRGLWLRGDGQAGFAAIPGQRSGLKIYGEQRGAAACDYDGDGRVDLAVSQNGAATKLYRNQGAAPGLRVRLAGPPGNPHAVGALLRGGTRDRLGPAREIHAGSGYWSQDSATQVLGGSLTRLRVRWPDGAAREFQVPAEAAEVLVRSDQLTVTARRR
jgi:hypothetical protein